MDLFNVYAVCIGIVAASWAIGYLIDRLDRPEVNQAQ